MPDPNNQPHPVPGEDVGPAQRVGSVIKGKWTLESLLGVGGMAAVFAASHRNGQRAALKILHLDFAREKSICERFLREAYVSNKVGHPATVQVLDDDMTENEEPFLIMELLEGETVRDAWKKSGRTMPTPQVLYICDAVLDCLAACHAIGVIHRDLKPANIFITLENVVKVLDFGVAQMRSATTERTATGTALGTPAYMSPEQAMGLVDQMDGRADIFSVGAMMHALITGQRINNGRTEQEALVMAATKPVPSVARIAPNVPIEIIQIVDKALAWDRRNRFADAREMQAAVRTALDAAATQGAPVPQAAPKRGRFPTAFNPPPAAGQPPPVMGPGLGLSGGIGAVPGVAMPQVAITSNPSLANMQAPSLQMPSQGAPQGMTTRPGAMNASAAPQAAAMEIAAPVGLAENDPRVVATRDAMRHVDRVLPSVRQFGWTHPATDRTLRTAYDSLADLLSKDPTALDLTVRPYSLMFAGHAVWEPAAPFDTVPYNLFACGMRGLQVAPGLTLDELRELFSLLLLDPVRDLPPEDDLAAAFWERGLPHVTYDVVDAFAEGDATAREAFWDESDRVEGEAAEAAQAHASRTEARAMAISTDRSALTRDGNVVRALLTLDDGSKHAMHAALSLGRDQWSDRYVDALVEGYLDSAVNRDAALVLASLRTSAQDLVVAGRMDIVFHLYRALIERLALRVQGADLQMLTASLTAALFGGETLALLFSQAQTQHDVAGPLASLLPQTGANELGTVLSALKAPLITALRDPVIAFLERAGQGRENEIAQGITGIAAENAPVVLSVLARYRTPGAQQAIAQLGQHEDPMVRVEARVLGATSPEQANQELQQLLQNPQPLLRMAAARATTRYRMVALFPVLANLLKAPSFNDLGVDERREVMRAVILLQPPGEGMILELAKKGGVLLSEEKEATRLAAIETLGEFSRNPVMASALKDLSTTRWGTSEDVRNQAAASSKDITGRVTSNARASLASITPPQGPGPGPGHSGGGSGMPQ